MFQKRLKILLLLMALPGLGIVVRLVQLQAVRASYYQAAGERMLERPVRYFPCLRGEIQDHEGRRLAFDAPAWNLCVRYEVIADDTRFIRALARKLPPDSPPIETLVEASWKALAEIGNLSEEDLQRRRKVIRQRVQTIKEQVSDLQGIEIVVAEEQMAHPIVRDLDQNQQAAARVQLASYPWVEVVGGHTRQYAGGESVGHLLGYLNEVDAEDIRQDPNRENELACYRAGDLKGAAGIEAMAEGLLRGLRGRQEEDIEGRALSEPIEAVNGRNLRLTIDLPLQQLVYEKLQAAVAANASSTGASAVLIDIPSRQILALVSCPGFEPTIGPSDRLLLEADELHRPLRFRAVAEHYPPGSIVKPIMLAGAWTDGKVGADTRVTCEGQLNAEPPQWRCLGHHGSADPVFAIQHSCNIFFYRIGDWLGVPRMAYWMQQVGLGRPAGTGLPEEVSGGVPAEGRGGYARNMAIGQWDVRVTPVQAANMVASIASGVYRPVALWADDPRPRPASPLPVTRSALRAVREGMYRVVNSPGGTAHSHIHLANEGNHVLLGKTGSAETQQGPVVERIFVCQFPDGSADELVAANRVDLLLKYPKAREAKILEVRPYRRFPTEEMDPAHAWFVGYLTTRGRYLESSTGGELNVALVVLIEFGGRGGGVAAPVAGEIVQAMLDMQNGTAAQARLPDGAPDNRPSPSSASGRRGGGA